VRVLLVNAGWGALFSGRVRRYNRAFPPLDLLNAAAILRAEGVAVSLADCRADPDARGRIDHDAYDLCITTLSALDRWQCPNTDLDQVDRFLAGFPRDRLILAGAQPTVQPEILLRRTGALGVILGEPEPVVVSLANGARPGEAAGTAALVDDALVRGPEAESLDVAAMPTPAFELLDYREYRYEVLGGRFGLLEATRGCPWTCKFCLLEMYGKRYRKKTPEQVATEVRAAWAAGIRTVYFQDLEFTVDHALVREICAAIVSTGLPLRWACQTRPDTVDEDLLRTMRQAGCELIHYGVESGVQRIVDSTGKRQTLEAVEAGIRAARAVGMRTLCYFLIGLPGETEADMAETLRFALRVRPTYASFQPATPYPGTDFHAEGSWDRPFPEVFDGPLDQAGLARVARRFTLRFHLSPRYLWDRITGPGRRHALREAGLLTRYVTGA
jgi:anaerobic magnesium-protoporphyrin IX monomethyl ester cyclase